MAETIERLERKRAAMLQPLGSTHDMRRRSMTEVYPCVNAPLCGAAIPGMDRLTCWAGKT